jgi:hypothetical protein
MWNRYSGDLPPRLQESVPFSRSIPRAVFLLHHAEAGSGNCPKQAIAQVENLGSIGLGAEIFSGTIEDRYSGTAKRIRFGSDYPSIPHARLLQEWGELGYPDDIVERVFHLNAERVLGL